MGQPGVDAAILHATSSAEWHLDDVSHKNVQAVDSPTQLRQTGNLDSDSLILQKRQSFPESNDLTAEHGMPPMLPSQDV